LNNKDITRYTAVTLEDTRKLPIFPST